LSGINAGAAGGSAARAQDLAMATYDIRIEREGASATVHLAGDFADLGQLLGEARRLTRELVDTGVERVLLLRETGRRAPPVVLVELLLALRDLGSDRFRCAVVYPDYGTDLEFYNSNASLRGIPHRLFADRESAEQYLRD
jgi:hypothetical protein